MVTRMDVDGYVHVVEGGEYVYYEDHQREVAQLQARVAELETAIARIETEALADDGVLAESALFESIMDARNV